MINTKLKLLYILLLLFIFKPLLADESWYQTAANLHKEWAKTYHTVSDLERYTSIHKLIIGKKTIELMAIPQDFYIACLTNHF